MSAIKLLAVVGLLAAAPAPALAHGCHKRWSRGPAAAVYVAPRPVWVPGYWRHDGHQRFWNQGAWVTPPQAGWTWVAPQSYWDGARGQWVWREGYWAPSDGYDQVSYR